MVVQLVSLFIFIDVKAAMKSQSTISLQNLNVNKAYFFHTTVFAKNIAALVNNAGL